MRRSQHLAVALLTVWLAAPIAGAPAAEKKLVRFNEVVRGLAYTPQYVALANDYFGDEGLKIDFRIAWGGTKSMTGLLTKRDDISLLGPEATYYAIEQGVPDPAINFAQLTNRDVTFIVGRPGAAKFTWEGLKGKNILSASAGSTPHMVLLWVLARHGLTAGKNVPVTPIRPPGSAPAFIEGRGDFIAVWEPFVSQIEKMGKGITVSSLGIEGGLLAYTTYAALASYIKKNPDTIQKFTNAIYKGMQWTDAHSSRQVAELIMPFFKRSPVDLVASSIERYRKQNQWRSDPILSDEASNALQDILIFNKNLKRRLPAAKFNVHGFAEQAVKTAALK